MKNYILCIIGISLTACGGSNTKQTATETIQKIDSLISEIDSLHIGDKVFIIQKISEQEFSKTPNLPVDGSEIKNLQKDSFYVHRTGDSLIFKLTNGKYATLTNNNADGDSYSKYTYLGRQKEIGQFLIVGAFYEWSNYFLINQDTGDTTVLSGVPAISADRKYLLDAGSNMMPEEGLNGFQLFKIDKNKLTLLGERELSKWSPDEIKWANESEVLVKRSMFHKIHEPEVDDFVKMTLQK